MDGELLTAPYGSACELCHRRKVRCDVHTGHVPCSLCKSLDEKCIPHRRKRKHDPPITPVTAKQKRGTNGPITAISSPASSRVSKVSQAHVQPETTPGQAVSYQNNVEANAGSYLGRAEYVSGTAPIDEEDARRYSSGQTADLADEDKSYLLDLQAFEMPTRSLYDSLLSSFFEHCYPWMPIVEPWELRVTATFKPSVLLRQSVFVAASRVSLAPDARALGNVYYRRAKALYHLGHEKNPMNVVRSICLLLWFNNSGPEHISLDASSFWLHMGVALAHQLGLHRESSQKPADTKLRRRLWWTLFIRDCQIATSHGRPRTINAEDCNVRPLALTDFEESDDDAHRFVAYLKICSILSDLTESLVRGTLGWTKQVSIESRLQSWIRDLPGQLQIYNRHTSTLRAYDFKSRQLNVMFFTAIMLLHRPASPGVVPSAAALLASSFSAGIFEDFLARGELGFLAPVFNFHLMTAAYAQLACYKYSLLWAKAEPELDIINKCLVEMAKRYPTAVGAQRVIKAVYRAVSTQKRHEGPVHVLSEPEMLKYFDTLSPDLCSKWSLAMPSQPFDPSSRVSPPIDPRLHFMSVGPDDNCRGSSNIVGTIQQQMDADLTMPTQQNPADDSSFGESLLADIGPNDSYFASNGAFTAVGNWMLGDWNADLAWMAGDV